MPAGSLCVRSGSCQRGEKRARYLEIPPLFINGDDELVDVGDQLVALGLPKSIRTLLQQLHQHILIKGEGGAGRGYRESVIAYNQRQWINLQLIQDCNNQVLPKSCLYAKTRKV